MDDHASVSDALQALTTLWPQLSITRTPDHIVVRDGDRTLFDGPDWGLLFFLAGLRAQIGKPKDEAKARGHAPDDPGRPHESR
ncbi:hypothetical protein [Flavisphingomonas formosensis]|uniref:hypothetical protein n=1 Tax=Flavisphingomonas formosensis TaxID=861534 RepID=UPI0012FBBDB6|nr:hypothetical protein [Sphingomonas formosensis]